MRNKALLVVGALLFLLSEVGVNYLIYKYKNNIELPKVELKDEEEENNSFAIMLEQSDGSYASTTSSSFNQEGYVFNTDKSGCMDINGNKIENSISYDDTTKAVVVKVNSTAYCYVYFDIFLDINAEELITEASLWSSGLSGDGYRYVGTNPNNYICFGTTSTSTCTGNTDAYMYRIIGVFKDSSGNSYMKLIKKEALNTAYAWHDIHTTNIDWGSSILYTGLNGNYYLSNTTYMPSGWSDRIATWSWMATNTQTNYIGSSTSNTGVSYYYSTGAGIYNSEHQVNTTTGCYNSSTSVNCSSTAAYTTVSAKIGLMYVSDYVLAGGSNYLSTKNSDNYSSLKSDSWMYLWNSYNDSSAPNTSYEWMMSRYGYGGDHFQGWRISWNSSLNGNNYVSHTASIRPAFYLASSQVIASGSGTLSDPYILK